MENEKQIEEMIEFLNNRINIERNSYFGKGCITIPLIEAVRILDILESFRKQGEGEWIEHNDDICGTYYTCSACGCDWTTIDGTPQENNMRYCPECGAKMKGERNENDGSEGT